MADEFAIGGAILGGGLGAIAGHFIDTGREARKEAEKMRKLQEKAYQEMQQNHHEMKMRNQAMDKRNALLREKDTSHVEDRKRRARMSVLDLSGASQATPVSGKKKQSLLGAGD